jgi:hypothetical protein
MMKIGSLIALVLFVAGSAAPQTKIDVNRQTNRTGPRPYIDVTSAPFNAKGNSSTDDTAAIQAALTAACATTTSVGSFPMHPIVLFPPGIYRVVQPQRPSTSPVFTISCQFLELLGLAGGNNSQFSNPASVISVVAGPSPNAAPVFLVQGVTNNARNILFKDLAVVGYNEAYWLRSTSDITFDRAPMSVTGGTKLADNVTLKITNSEEIWRINESNADTNQGGMSPTTPTVLYTNESPLSSESPVDAYIHTSDAVDAGGGEEIIQRVNPSNAIVQNFTFDRNFIEDSNTGFLTATNTSGSAMSVGPMSFDGGGGIEPYTMSEPFLTLNDSLGSLYGITMNHVADGSVAIQILAGHLYDFHVIGCNIICSTQVTDANGNSIGTGTATERYGAADHFSDESFESAAPTAGLGTNTDASPTIADRWCASGVRFCSMGVDPSFGLLFGLGDSNAFNAGLKQTTIETVDVQFARLLPPTRFSGAATTGGTLRAGTYYSQIWTTENSNCTTAPTSSPTYSTGVVVRGSNNAINYTWTVPVSTPAIPTGYCLEIQNSAISPGSAIFAYLFASGAGTTTFSYTGQTQNATTLAPANAMVSEHRFTYQSETLGATTVGALPAASSLPGAIAHVTDSTTVSAEGQTCVGGNSNTALAFSNGSVWKCF